MAVTHNREYLFTGDRSGTLIKICNKKHKIVQVFSEIHDSTITGICITNNNEWVITASKDGSVKIFSLKKSRL